MISVAPLRYRNVLVQDGGPIAKIECGNFSVRGRPVVLANAHLASGLKPKSAAVLFSDADGTGTDPLPTVARHKAISEALERWAFHATVRSEEGSKYGFDVDASTTGMAAFPGLFRRHARRAAMLEGVERFSLCGWWEGRIEAHRMHTDWPGVSALAIEGPFGGVTAIVWAQTSWGGYVYGHAAEETFGAACEKAIVELARHEWVLRGHWLGSVAGCATKATQMLERRCIFFASEEGHELFQRRLTERARGAAPEVDVIADAHIPGPWDDYATVWRFALRPPSDGYLRGGERYFFL